MFLIIKHKGQNAGYGLQGSNATQEAAEATVAATAAKGDEFIILDTLHPERSYNLVVSVSLERK